MFSKVFVKDAAERAVKAFASTILSVLVVGDKAFNLVNANWTDALGVGGGAALASVLLSVASYKAGSTGTASAVKQVVYNGDSRVL
ncbi:holin [Streptomyces phage BillNye]|uniref:Holin n=2 Tax=Wilnyevirus billnye TaxID=2560486 RepID=A0A2L1IVQ1_9CAUD|nr:holin [Streptomyces phage BillNye]AVD99248.1 holin [Streptomyces phage BillNye]QBZ72332.1 holin [Streptomyces phage Circinus]